MTQPRLLGGRYELDGVVGRGGMAEVYRARDIRLDRVVAVKTLRDDLARDQTFQARFRREAQSAASLNHPSIVAVYDTGEDTSEPARVPYIVMEYVDGRTLRDLLRDDRRLLPERALEITEGVLRALDYSHRNSIVHRDIKPGNVMLTRSAEVKVMDFGIARAVSDAQATMTQTAQVIGTAQYLSPEQARGERVDARSDVYSTGCLLYELLTGRPPFMGDSPVAIAYQHVRENPVPPSQVDPEIPAWADSIVLRAMAKDPAQRYQSASEMRTDIQRALSGMPVAPPRGTQRMGSTALEPTARATTARYGYGPPEDGDADVGAGGPGGRRRRRRTAVLATLGALIVVAVVGAFGYAMLGGGGNSYSVPAVSGQTLTSAQQAIARAGLQSGPVKRQASASVHKGHVIKTDPPFGTKVKKNQVVTLFVSTGPQTYKVPGVVGDQESTATSQLSRFKVKTQQDPNSTKPQGQVTKQSPKGGVMLPAGAPVTIWVSGGASTVPSVENLPKATAQKILKNDGFNVNVITSQAQASTQPGTVFYQNPSQGSTLQQGGTVTIYVAKQPATASPSPSASPSSTPSGSPSPTPSGGGSTSHTP